MGIWWFLASEIMLFGGFFASFIVYRMGSAGWGGEAAHLSVPIAVANTLILLTSSLTMVQAFAAAKRSDLRGARRNLFITIALGLAFLCLKGVEYSLEIGYGFVPGRAMFWSFYYTMTGLHGLHVLAGVVVNALQLGGGKYKDPARLEAVGLYWHFVDVVWIFLFPLIYLS